MKVLVSGDWHLDVVKIGRVDPATDLDLRVKDFFNAVDFMIDYAIRNKVDLFVMNGDLFKGRTSSHHIETLVAERFKKIASNMRLVVNLGNHDYTPKQLAYGTHTYSILQKHCVKNIQIYTDITHVQIDNTDIIFYPYYDLRRTAFESNEQLISWVHDEVGKYELTQPCKLFIGHGTPKGTILNEDFYFDLDIIDEPILPHTLFEPFDMVLFSHIHRRHAISPQIFHIGSPERVNFGEAEDDKGFVIYDTDLKKMQWVSTNPRPMKDIRLDLLDIDEFTDPSDKIVESFSKLPNLDQHMLKIEVACSSQTLSQIDHNKIKGELEKAFYYLPIKYDTPRIQKSRNKEVTEQSNEIDALERVVNARTDLSDLDKKQILIRGRAIVATNNESD